MTGPLHTIFDRKGPLLFTPYSPYLFTPSFTEMVPFHTAIENLESLVTAVNVLFLKYQ